MKVVLTWSSESSQLAGVVGCFTLYRLTCPDLSWDQQADKSGPGAVIMGKVAWPMSSCYLPSLSHIIELNFKVHRLEGSCINCATHSPHCPLSSQSAHSPQTVQTVHTQSTLSTQSTVCTQSTHSSNSPHTIQTQSTGSPHTVHTVFIYSPHSLHGLHTVHRQSA